MEVKSQLLTLNSVMELLDVKSQGKNQEFCHHVVDSAHQEPGEDSNVYDGTECALHGKIDM
ncbi:MAG: hypothetical protein FWF59_07840 [Turicibacter sp.]|nr:hypothetical protein [Turicibacter sp.]